MAALIAFYSRADENYFGGDLRYIKVGNTHRAAEMIQEAVGGELFQIRQQEPYSADYRTCVDQARRDWQEKARPALAAFPESLEGTHEGSGMSGTEGKIAQTCPGATVCKGLAIHGSHIEDSRKTIQSWAAGK